MHQAVVLLCRKKNDRLVTSPFFVADGQGLGLGVADWRCLPELSAKMDCCFDAVDISLGLGGSDVVVGSSPGFVAAPCDGVLHVDVGSFVSPKLYHRSPLRLPTSFRFVNLVVHLARIFNF